MYNLYQHHDGRWKVLNTSTNLGTLTLSSLHDAATLPCKFSVTLDMNTYTLIAEDLTRKELTAFIHNNPHLLI